MYLARRQGLQFLYLSANLTCSRCARDQTSSCLSRWQPPKRAVPEARDLLLFVLGQPCEMLAGLQNLRALCRKQFESPPECISSP
jgi:hypothetical protein